MSKKPAEPAKPPEEKALLGPLSFKNQLMHSRAMIVEVLPKMVDPQRYIRVALMALNRPELQECTPMSALECVMDAAKLGLDFSPVLGEAYAVPFRNKDLGVTEVKMLPGYQGLQKLARESGDVEIDADCVFEGDKFIVRRGTDPGITHEPRGDRNDDSKITHAYAVATLKGGGRKFEVMTRAQIEVIRSRSKQSNGPLWRDNYHEACRKTVVKRLSKYLPKSPDSRFTAALEREHELDLVDGFATVLDSETQAPAQNRAEKAAARLKAEREAQDAAAVAAGATVPPPAQEPPEAAGDEQPSTGVAAAVAPSVAQPATPAQPAKPEAPKAPAQPAKAAADRFAELVKIIQQRDDLHPEDAEAAAVAFLARYNYQPDHLDDDGRWNIVQARLKKAK